MPPRFLFRLFPWASGASGWVERRMAPSGRLVLSMAVAGALFGIDISQTLGYQIAALMAALLVTSVTLSLGWRPRLAIRRVAPDRVTDGVGTSYWLEIENQGKRLERDLMVHDRLRDAPISYAAFLAARRDDAAGRRNWFDRAVGFPRWVELRRRTRGALVEPLRLPPLAPGATLRVRVEMTPLRRGWIEFERIELLRPDPLGMVYARHARHLRSRVLALPRRHALPRVSLSSERRYQKGGVSLAHAVGDSQEFASLRDYRPGDPRRHVHWRSFAKTGRLIVKQYQDEYFDRHALVVDTHLADAPPAQFEAVISVAASVVAGERSHDAILDVLFAGADVIQLSAGRGLGDSLQALGYLAEVQPAQDSDFDALGQRLRERGAQLASVILVLGRWDASRRGLVRELAARGVATVSLNVALDERPSVVSPASGAHRAYAVRVGHLAEDLARLEFRA